MRADAHFSRRHIFYTSALPPRHSTKMLSLLVSTTALVAKPNALRLRGGLADVDPTMVANGALALTGLNAGIISLSPSKAGEIYEVALSEADEAIVKYMGLTLLGQAMMIYYTMQGTDVATAIGYSIIPQLIGNVQGMLNDEPGKLFGQEGAAKYINPALSAFMVYTLLGSGSPVDAGTAITAYAAWGALNGVGMYFATDKLMEAWGASGAKIQKTFLKSFGGFLTISGLTMYLLNSGEDAVKTLGYATVATLATMVDGQFISKDQPGSEASQKFWLAINAAIAGFTLL